MFQNNSLKCPNHISLFLYTNFVGKKMNILIKDNYQKFTMFNYGIFFPAIPLVGWALALLALIGFYIRHRKRYVKI